MNRFKTIGAVALAAVMLTACAKTATTDNGAQNETKAAAVELSAEHSGLQKGNYRKIKGLSVLFARIKRKYIANGGCRNAVAVAFCSQGAMQNISLFRKYLLRTG